MADLPKLFDRYSLGARVKPSFLLFLPVVIVVFVIYEPSRSVGGALLTFLSSFGVIAFGANQMSSRGNQLQDKLYKEWGGAPTTLIMRPDSPKLDRETRERYCKKLEEMIPNFKAPTDEEALANPNAADQKFRSAATFLLEKTRDAKKYPLILNENIEYGFSRNLRACKWAGVTIALICCALSAGLLWAQLPESPSLKTLAPWRVVSIPYYLLVCGNGLILFAWLALVTKEWVKVRGFAYALRLYASCEHIG